MDSPPDPIGIPLPMSTVGSPEMYTTPLQSPRMSNTRWFADRSLHASPTNSPPPRYRSDPIPASPFPLSPNAIEIVPPTPPEFARPVEFGENDVPTYPHPTPRSMVSNISEGKRRSHRSSRMMMVDRVSRSFHTGTPPPAIVRLRNPDDTYYTHEPGAYSRRPVSNVYVRGGGGDGGSNGGDSKRSSIISQQSARSRRQSVAALIKRFERGGSKRVKKVPTYESAPPPPPVPTTTSRLQPPSRPPPPVPYEEEEEDSLRERKRSTGQNPDVTMSDDTHVATVGTGGGGTAEGSPKALGSSTAESTEALSMSLVDPLTVLERRRRRDFTIGSHNPLSGPPNTPALVPRKRLSETNKGEPAIVVQAGLPADEIIEAEEEEPEFDQFGYLAAKFMRIWTRIGDMPWVAHPCVATLVIPQSNSVSNGDGGSSTGQSLSNATPWYRPKPSLDELLGEVPTQYGRANDSRNNSTLDELGQGYNNNHSQSHLQRPRRQRQRSDATTAVTTTENDGTSMETVVTPTSPTRKKGVWHPRMPEPIAQRMGKERFGDALVIRGLRRMSS
ncbi:hypothetical protein FRB91_004967 [Serendipita sp. 411]|nr:hypothetical protein FRB91_004967 [Serendipita sp. 411]